MNSLYVSALFDPGHVKVVTYDREDGSSFAVISFDAHDGPALSVHVKALDEVAELEAALAEVREFLTNPTAARDAA